MKQNKTLRDLQTCRLGHEVMIIIQCSIIQAAKDSQEKMYFSETLFIIINRFLQICATMISVIRYHVGVA